MDLNLPLEYEYYTHDAGASQPMAAILLLHGRGANEHDLLPLASYLPKNIHVFSLRAPFVLGPGYAWYELDIGPGGLHGSQPEPNGFRNSLDKVHESVSEIMSALDIQPSDIGLLGFSQGAIMNFAFTLDHPNTIGWCVGLHGYLAESHSAVEPPAIQEKPVFIGAGANDQIIPAERAETAADRFRQIGCTVTFNIYNSGHEISPTERNDFTDWIEHQLTK